jgi:nucleoside-diphosphate-sugar epimerase
MRNRRDSTNMEVRHGPEERRVRVAVTGATGNVGSVLLPALARFAEVDEIVGVARHIPSWTVPKVRWHAARVERDTLVGAFDGADVVVHLAWIIQPSRDTERQRIVNVIGTQRVLEAAAAAGVGAIVHASSVGTYSPAPRDHLVDESWPTDGTARLAYSWQKAYVERLLDRFERDRPSTRVVRMRPALIMQRMAGHEVKRYFLGPLVPSFLLQPRPLLAALCLGPLQLQAVHAVDVAEAFALAIMSEATGAFNVAAPEVLGQDRPALVPLLAQLANLTFDARLQRTSGGWVEAAAQLPLMDTSRIRRELGWKATWTAADAVADLLGGMRDGATGPTPPLT